MAGIQKIAFGGLWDQIKKLLQQLGALTVAVGNFLLEFFTSSGQVQVDIGRIRSDAEELKQSVEREIQALQDFKFDPKWNTRVINVTKAIDQLKALAAKVANTFQGKLQELLQPFKDLEQVFQQEAAPDPLGDKPSGLAKANAKYNEIVTAIHSFANAMDDVKDMAKVFEEITNDIQSLEPIFLQQGNSRERLPKDHKAPFVRLGKLHEDL